MHCLQIYYCGGLPVPVNWNKNTIGDCTILTLSEDGLGGTWAPMAEMLDGVNHAWTCTDGKKMYIFGGRNNDTWNLSKTQIYDPETDTWTTTDEVRNSKSG